MKFFSHGILGMNARNLRYIRAKNSAESISLADSKLKTKNFLSSRGIPFAENYVILSSHQELTDFSLSSIPTDHFVIKPNKGSRGRGILIVKREEEGYMIDGAIWTEDEVKLYMTDILHGSFSLHGSSDTIVIEELLAPGTDFAPYCEHGLADIRVIVYNFVPVMAMIRMPTISSGKKANLNQGGIGLGINIASGQIISLFQNRTIYTQIFPSEHEGLKNRMLPFWDDILLFSSQIQVYTKLGYLALDWVITKNGPKLLEINARAGLGIQNVNLAPLASRLKKIEGIKVLTPEKGVEVAKTLFHTEILSSSAGKKVLHLEQMGTIGDREVTISVDLSRNMSTVSKDIMEGMDGSSVRILTDLNVSVTLKNFDMTASHTGKVILGKDALQNYLLDPTSRIPTWMEAAHKRWTKELVDFDHEVYRIGKKVNLSPILRPDNYFACLDAFIQDPHGYNPVFAYRFPSQEKLESIKSALGKLTETAYGLKQSGLPIADLYIEKLTENDAKLWLVEACRNEDFERIQYFNSLLFGQTDEELLKMAREKVLEMKGYAKTNKALLGKVLSLDEISDHIQKYFELHNIRKVPIAIKSGNLSRMSVSYGREVKIHIAKNAKIREREIDSILAHEIDTHFRRYIAGHETGLKLFQFGTGYYLSDEEGLAIYRSFSHLPDGYEKNAMYLKYYLLAMVDTLSFAETVELLISLSPEKSLESIFAGAVRLKRGIIHTETTGIPGTAYQKDKIYLDGYTRIHEWVENGGDQDQLFYGKVKIGDLGIIRGFSF